MRYSTTSAMVLGALIGEAIAGPTHAHLHRHAHAKKDVDWNTIDWDNLGIDWVSAWRAGQHSSTTAAPVATATPTAAAVAPAATTAAAAAGTQSSSSGSSSAVNTVESDAAELWAGLVGLSNSRTSFGGKSAASGSTGDNYYGNTGVPYGSNVIKVDSTEGYEFTNTFVNTQSQSITVNIWQKVGPDMQPLSGSALAPTKTTLTFVLKPGASQIVAFQDNTQVAWAQACSSTTESGAYDNTWGEANFVSTGSGYDVSAIMNSAGNNYEMTITSVEAPGCTSDRNQNMWLTASDPVGGSDGSCYIAQSTATLKTIMGGTV